MAGKPKFAVFASGSGSNFQAIHDAIEAGQLSGTISLVVSDKPEAFVLVRAKTAGIQTLAVKPTSFSSKEAFELHVLQKLKELEVEWIVLAGYMRLIGTVLLEAYPSKIINIHPSLLPAFPGKDAIGQAMEHGVKVTGVTVHYVDAGMDTGPILAQAAVDVVDGDKEQTKERIHSIEHELYTKTLQKLWSL
ncbi:phosphoribosylglycinamide formyltransferase [Bacillus sp. FJAT-22090]|uniref:phosphoribosylglycinamide formyltransferase n=1 Tax=Bacillus sp. FJAT-22090 TaxID=1581038 RepID=UPI00119FAFF4|nr:phosphoribosylglycinamide formyltransferase [Bacillus sp. FJAT-22090]